MRFDFDAYEKVYPPKQETQPIESAVDTFKPTEEEIKAMDNQPGDDAQKKPADNKPQQPAENDPQPAPEPKGEQNG